MRGSTMPPGNGRVDSCSPMGRQCARASLKRWEEGDESEI